MKETVISLHKYYISRLERTAERLGCLPISKGMNERGLDKSVWGGLDGKEKQENHTSISL